MANGAGSAYESGSDSALGATSAALHALEAELTASGELDLRAGGRALSQRRQQQQQPPPLLTLEGEVRRVQHDFADASNVLAIAIDEGGWWGSEPQRFAKKLRAHSMALHAAAKEEGVPEKKAERRTRDIHLLVQYFEASSVERQVEIDQCLLQNIRNEHIHTCVIARPPPLTFLTSLLPQSSVHIALIIPFPCIVRRYLRLYNVSNLRWHASIHLLTEKAFDLSYFHEFAESLWGHSHIVQVVVGARLTFARAFAYAHEHVWRAGAREGNTGGGSGSDFVNASAVMVLANADIFFDDTLGKVRSGRIELDGCALALLRWNVGTDGALHWSPRIDQQDAWVMSLPLPATLRKACGRGDCDFPLGLLQADNRIAAILQDAGLRVSNPALALVARHLQLGTGRSYTDQDTVPGKSLFVRISDAYT